MYEFFLSVDATQVEINPFGKTPSGDVVCFDSKISFDENAAYRQKDVSLCLYVSNIYVYLYVYLLAALLCPLLCDLGGLIMGLQYMVYQLLYLLRVKTAIGYVEHTHIYGSPIILVGRYLLWTTKLKLMREKLKLKKII